MQLSVIIPAYNESAVIVDTLETVISYFREKGWEHEVLVSDDGSTDNTVALAQDMARTHPEVRVLENAHKGKGHAVYQGVQAARGTYLYFCDADLSTPITDFDLLWERMTDDVAMVVASREGARAHRVDEPWYRHVMGRIFNYLVRFLTVRGINDTQCGFKLLRSDVAREVFSRMRLYGDDAKELDAPAVTAFDVEMLFIAQKLGYQLIEVPVTWEYREATRVSPVRDSIRNFGDVVRVRVNDLRGVYDQ